MLIFNGIMIAITNIIIDKINSNSMKQVLRIIKGGALVRGLENSRQ